MKRSLIPVAQKGLVHLKVHHSMEDGKKMMNSSLVIRCCTLGLEGSGNPPMMIRVCRIHSQQAQRLEATQRRTLPSGVLHGTKMRSVSHLRLGHLDEGHVRMYATYAGRHGTWDIK